MTNDSRYQALLDQHDALTAQAGHLISLSCIGERCNICGQSATHKVAEDFNVGDPGPDPHEGFRLMHGFTAYTCCGCFRKIMGPAVPCKET